MYITQLAGAVEVRDWFFAEGQDSPNECLDNDTKQSDGEAPLMLEFWGMWSTILLPLFPGPHWLRVVAPDRVK